MNKKAFCIIYFFISSITFAQESKSFFIEVPNINNVPVITHNKNGTRKTYSKTANSNLNKVINSHKIYTCKRVFANSKKLSLNNIYLIECNNLKLMDELFKNFRQIYPRVENATGTSLAIPNDYSSTGGYLGNQAELDYIRAPETWDITTGSSDIKIGISDTNFTENHEDFLNTLSVEVNVNSNNLNGNQHGSRVSSFAAANTNNGKGISAIGYDSFIYGGVGLNTSVLDDLSMLPGVKVLNASWFSHTTINGLPRSSFDWEKNAIEDIIDERGIVVVAAAGNGQNSSNGDPDKYYWPASYKNVISVSSIGHIDKNFWDRQTFLDEHEYLRAGQIRSHQHNDSIDIVAPGYGMVAAYPNSGSGLSSYIGNREGTSYSAPIVAGTVALMFDVNYCIDPKEVETILKLTAVKIDHLPQNIQYYGKLGAGKLDAYEAVKMAKDMADTYGTVEVKDRILYRPWFYKLETAPYEIKMTNNDVNGGSKLKFKARNNIEILSGDYSPDTGGYIDLSIDSNLDLDCPLPNSSSSSSSSSSQGANTLGGINSSRLLVFPNPTANILNIINEEDLSEVTITDITGKMVYYMRDINRKELQINTVKFNSGIYFMKAKMKSGEITSTTIIKD